MTDREAIEAIEIVQSSDYHYDETLGYQLTSDDFDWLEKAKAALQERIDREKNESAMKRLFNGEWVETGEACKALGITFADGFQVFDFSRTAEWWSIVGKTDKERAREGQRVTTFFRLKTAMPGEEV